jgi:hypothetical protein
LLPENSVVTGAIQNGQRSDHEEGTTIVTPCIYFPTDLSCLHLFLLPLFLLSLSSALLSFASVSLSLYFFKALYSVSAGQQLKASVWISPRTLLTRGVLQMKVHHGTGTADFTLNLP